MKSPSKAGTLASLVIITSLAFPQAAQAATTISTAELKGSTVRIVGSGTTPTARILVNGGIKLGGQLLSPAHRLDPTTYYGKRSGVGLAREDAQRNGPITVGVIGLGTGTIACYGRLGDLYVFYEINPLVVGLAFTEFSFLKGSAARTPIPPPSRRRPKMTMSGPSRGPNVAGSVLSGIQ